MHSFFPFIFFCVDDQPYIYIYIYILRKSSVDDQAKTISWETSYAWLSENIYSNNVHILRSNCRIWSNWDQTAEVDQTEIKLQSSAYQLSFNSMISVQCTHSWGTQSLPQYIHMYWAQITGSWYLIAYQKTMIYFVLSTFPNCLKRCY